MWAVNIGNTEEESVLEKKTNLSLRHTEFKG